MIPVLTGVTRLRSRISPLTRRTITKSWGIDRGAMRGNFRTAPRASDSRFTFAVIGDSGNGGENQLAVARLLERMKPDLILHTGDVVYTAGTQRCYEPSFFEPYQKSSIQCRSSRPWAITTLSPYPETTITCECS